MNGWRHLAARAVTYSLLALLSACSRQESTTAAAPSKIQGAGVIRIDGSSTVFPLAEAVAEEFQSGMRGAVRVTVGVSGTGGGFKKLCRGDTDIANASRPILAEEMQACRVAGIQFMELPVAFDAITVVVHRDNDWAQTLAVADLKKMWEPAAQGTITRWNQVRREWPDAPLMLYGPGADSGTFDYFTEAVTGAAKSSRGDYTASEDDNVLVQGVEHDKNALGYFGLAYYLSNQERIRAVPIRQEKGAAVAPSATTVRDGSYQPLSRPLFVYVSEAAARRPEVRKFMEFYLTESPALATQAGIVPLPESAAALAMKHFRDGRLGSVFGGVPEVGVTIEDLLAREAKL